MSVIRLSQTLLALCDRGASCWAAGGTVTVQQKELTNRGYFSCPETLCFANNRQSQV